MSGRFIAVVGPSGVGKDSVMAAMAAAEPRVQLARRFITRPSDAGGEAFDAIDVAGFKTKRDNEDFALWWPAHGLYYGIPIEVDALLAAGQDVVANLSRGVLEQAMDRFDTLMVIALTAQPDILKARLEHRNREDGADISRRLRRAEYLLPPSIDAITLDNSGPLEDTVTRALEQLFPESGKAL
jgi:ribose 1,5-bisphosphokinase